MEAQEFSTSKNYAVGDLTLYGGRLYQFTSTHSAGAWDAEDVKQYDQSREQDLTRIIAGVENTQKAIAYAGTVVFAPVQIEGTRYKYSLTNARDPRK